MLSGLRASLKFLGGGKMFYTSQLAELHHVLE